MSMIMLLLLLLLSFSHSLRIPPIILLLLQQTQTDQISKVQPHFPNHDRVPNRLPHAIPPLRLALPHAAQLPPQQRVELVQPLLRPLHAAAHHDGRETLLVRLDRVADEGEVDVGELVDVVGQVAFEDDAAGAGVDEVGPGGKVGGAGDGGEVEADEVGDVGLRC